MGEASSLSPIEPARIRAVPDADGETRSMSAFDVHHYLQFVGRAMGIVPRFVRDTVYDFVARIRHRVVKAPDGACPVPPEGRRGRFLP